MTDLSQQPATAGTNEDVAAVRADDSLTQNDTADDPEYGDSLRDLAMRRMEADKRADEELGDLRAKKEAFDSAILEKAQEYNRYFRRLSQEAAEMEKKFPGFDLGKEFKNDRFYKLTMPGSGMSLEDAYRFLHMDEAIAAAREAARREERARISREFRRRMARPDEIRGGAAIVTRTDAGSMDSAQREDLRRKIYDAAARGEKLYPDRY